MNDWFAESEVYWLNVNRQGENWAIKWGVEKQIPRQETSVSGGQEAECNESNVSQIKERTVEPVLSKQSESNVSESASKNKVEQKYL